MYITSSDLLSDHNGHCVSQSDEWNKSKVLDIAGNISRRDCFSADMGVYGIVGRDPNRPGKFV